MSTVRVKELPISIDEFFAESTLQDVIFHRHEGE
jgi:hypothetical protein